MSSRSHRFRPNPGRNHRRRVRCCTHRLIGSSPKRSILHHFAPEVKAIDVIFLTSPLSPHLPITCRRWYNPVAMNPELFEKLVAEAFDRLPQVFLERLENVAVVVEDWPDPATMRAVRVSSPYQLLGFYHGVPQTVRTKDYGLVPPDRISIYRRPIEVRCRTVEEARQLVERVLLHEIAHHFGISDDRLDEIGAY